MHLFEVIWFRDREREVEGERRLHYFQALVDPTLVLPGLSFYICSSSVEPTCGGVEEASRVLDPRTILHGFYGPCNIVYSLRRIFRSVYDDVPHRPCPRMKS